MYPGIFPVKCFNKPLIIRYLILSTTFDFNLLEIIN